MPLIVSPAPAQRSGFQQITGRFTPWPHHNHGIPTHPRTTRRGRCRSQHTSLVEARTPVSATRPARRAAPPSGPRPCDPRKSIAPAASPGKAASPAVVRARAGPIATGGCDRADLKGPRNPWRRVGQAPNRVILPRPPALPPARFSGEEATAVRCPRREDGSETDLAAVIPWTSVRVRIGTICLRRACWKCREPSC